jgi:hypothetical protein
MVKKPSFAVFVLLFLWVAGCESFAPFQASYFQGTTSMLNLHPDQAEELVECAKDLMKQSMVENEAAAKILSADISEKLKAEAASVYSTDDRQELSSHGPMSWVRKRLWPFKLRQHGSPRGITTTAIASKKLP